MKRNHPFTIIFISFVLIGGGYGGIAPSLHASSSQRSISTGVLSEEEKSGERNQKNGSDSLPDVKIDVDQNEDDPVEEFARRSGFGHDRKRQTEPLGEMTNSEEKITSVSYEEKMGTRGLTGDENLVDWTGSGPFSTGSTPEKMTLNSMNQNSASPLKEMESHFAPMNPTGNRSVSKSSGRHSADQRENRTLDSILSEANERFGQKRFNDAEKLYREYLGLVNEVTNPTMTTLPYHRLGIIAKKRQQIEKAQNYLIKAIKSDAKKDPRITFDYAVILYDIGEYERAQNLFSYLVKNYPDIKEARLYFGQSLLNTNPDETILPLLEEEYGKAEATRLLAEKCREKGKIDLALRLERKLKEDQIKNDQIFFLETHANSASTVPVPSDSEITENFQTDGFEMRTDPSLSGNETSLAPVPEMTNQADETFSSFDKTEQGLATDGTSMTDSPFPEFDSTAVIEDGAKEEMTPNGLPSLPTLPQTDVLRKSEKTLEKAPVPFPAPEMVSTPEDDPEALFEAMNKTEEFSTDRNSPAEPETNGHFFSSTMDHSRPQAENGLSASDISLASGHPGLFMEMKDDKAASEEPVSSVRNHPVVSAEDPMNPSLSDEENEEIAWAVSSPVPQPNPSLNPEMNQTAAAVLAPSQTPSFSGFSGYRLPNTESTNNSSSDRRPKQTIPAEARKPFPQAIVPVSENDYFPSANDVFADNSTRTADFLPPSTPSNRPMTASPRNAVGQTINSAPIPVIIPEASPSKTVSEAQRQRKMTSEEKLIEARKAGAKITYLTPDEYKKEIATRAQTMVESARNEIKNDSKLSEDQKLTMLEKIENL